MMLSSKGSLGACTPRVFPHSSMPLSRRTEWMPSPEDTRRRRRFQAGCMRMPARPETVGAGCWRRDIVTVAGKMLPTKRGTVDEEIVGHGLAVGAELGHCPAQRDRVPEEDGSASARACGNAGALVLTRTVADLLVAMAAPGAGKGRPGLAFLTSRKGLSILETRMRLWTYFLDGIAVPPRCPSRASRNRTV